MSIEGIAIVLVAALAGALIAAFAMHSVGTKRAVDAELEKKMKEHDAEIARLGGTP